MGSILLEGLNAPPMEKRKVEVVERKGIGHPDTICDSVFNQISVELCREYIKTFGVILHHNIDKGLLVAGEVEHKFGGGRMKTPMLLVIGDRATYEAEGKEIPVNEIAIRTAKEWFRENIRFIDPEEHVRYQVELKKGSAELTDIFRRRGKVLGANDTSAAVGYAPMSETERLVYETERFLNSREFKELHPESGEDVKVMGFRTGDEINFTIAMAFVEKFIKNEDDYFRKKDAIVEEVISFLKNRTSKKITVDMNTLDARGRGINGVYLTLFGTSAEDGDCGQIGRGNRVNGVIALNRPMSTEAAAGKNPVSHVGKIYNVLSFRLAEKIHEKVSEAEEVYVWLLSQIGKPIDQPKMVAVQFAKEKGDFDITSVRDEIEDVINGEFSNIKKFTEDLAFGRIAVV